MRKLLLRTFTVFMLSAISISCPKDILALSDTLEITNFFNDYDPVKTIVIDPGHGGKDSGTQGSYTLEKDIALDIALRLGHLLQTTYPKIKILYTRDSDKFVPLFERTAMANRNHADLFVSIHCNASKRKSASGTETFVMGLHKSEENLDIAKRENQAVLLEDNYQQNYGGYDPNSPEGHIILSAYQNQNLENSIALAQFMQTEMSKGGIKVSRGVKQAGFVVLRTATMPSILIETGFLSNKNDESYLSTREGKTAVANSIFIGIEKFVEAQNSNAYQKPNLVYKPKQPVKKKEVKYTPPKPQKEDVVVKPKAIDSNIRYSVQIAATSSKVNLKEHLNKETLDYWLIHEKGMYKYMTGNFTDLPSAYEYREYLVKDGFKGAFIFKYKIGEKEIIAP